jgi:hypothetical protein
MHPLASVVTNAPLSGPRGRGYARGPRPGIAKLGIWKIPRRNRRWCHTPARPQRRAGGRRNAHRMGTFNVVVSLVLAWPRP